MNTLTASLLAPLGYAYGVVMLVRRAAYAHGLIQQHSLPGKTIAIGNLEVGGTGKTPITIALASYLRAHGFRPAILTRGYRSGLAPHDSMALVGADMVVSPLVAGDYHPDEPKLAAVTLGDVPVIIGAQRHAAAERFLDLFAPPTHWLLDDGFQHLALTRDLNIVLLDAAAPFASERVLPAGRLREPVRVLAHADALLLTRGTVDRLPDGMRHRLEAFGKPLIGVPFAMSVPLAMTAGAPPLATLPRIALIAGIARPERLVVALAAQGIVAARTRFLPDHGRIPADAIFATGCDAILTTAKDWARDEAALQAAGRPVYVVDVHPELPSNVLGELLAPVL